MVFLGRGGGGYSSRSPFEVDSILSPSKNPATGACFDCRQFKSKGGNCSVELKISC
jgi:hypothetical protein